MPLDPTSNVAWVDPVVTVAPPLPYWPWPPSPVPATVHPAAVSALVQFLMIDE